ncbi:MAG TPA: MaoC family dehydratase N-terminal domain-containing protein [Dehalococcoidia bacterium]|nr:MaoC family dehydratase N-terminal domain-containing protein [Dehalococcoidia bacterium]
MADEFDLEKARQQIGQESESWPYEVTTTSVRMYARAIGYSDRVFYDEEEAKRRGYRGLPVPPGYLGTPVFDPERSDPTFGFPRGQGPRLELPTKGLLDGGTQTEYSGDWICSGDKLEVTQKLADVTQRQGGLGNMVFVTNEAVYKRNGEVVARQRLTSIHY